MTFGELSVFFLPESLNMMLSELGLTECGQEGLNGFSAESRLSASQRKKAAVTRDRQSRAAEDCRRR